MKRIRNPSRDARIIAMHEAGATLKATAAHFHTSASSVLRIWQTAHQPRAPVVAAPLVSREMRAFLALPVPRHLMSIRQ